jgi:hypothetical protein
MKHTNAILSMGLLLSLSVCTTENPSEWYCDICVEEVNDLVENFDGDDVIATSLTRIERSPVVCAPGAGCMITTLNEVEVRLEGASGSLRDSSTERETASELFTVSCNQCSEED